MTKRLSQKDLENEFSQRDCELLEEYKNNYTPLKFRCSCGSISTITYKSFRRGSKCLNCSGKVLHTFETVRKYIKSEGYELLEEEYTGAFTIMKTKCPEGHIYETHWNNFQQGRRCVVCKPKIVGDQLRLNYEQVKKVFEDAGCELLSNDYKGNHKPLKYKCCCGRTSKIALANFQNGSRCAKCRSDNMSGDKHHNWIKDRKEAKLRELMRKRCTSMLKNVYRLLGKRKKSKSYEILGYTPQDLREHVTNHPNWSKVKDKKWHLDHIFPIKAFCDYGVTDLSLINCLENLQPLIGRENLKKHAKYNELEFERWIEDKGYEIIEA